MDVSAKEEAIEPDKGNKFRCVPARRCGRLPKDAQMYENPVSADRFMTALSRCNPSEHLHGALLHGQPTDAIQIYSGPPGTGKTHELIGALALIPMDERVLVVHPTNVGACMLYCRLNAAGVRCSLIIPKSRLTPDTPALPGRDSVHARVVVCTVSGRHSPRLVSAHFQHVLMDEAGQVPEPLAWSLLDASVRTLRMFGDLRQLPGVMSADAVRLNLEASLMQRLTCLAYPVVSGLVQRRMHPEIVRYPNSAFYGGALETEYTPSPMECPAYEYILVRGEEEKKGTSYRNIAEASAVAEEVSRLRGCGARDIVVLTGYSAQVAALVERVDVPVHTIDSFQGREADVCVLSTVRTTAAGFWGDPRRLNVGLTRAKHAFRVVGWPHGGETTLSALYRDARERGKVTGSNERYSGML